MRFFISILIWIFFVGGLWAYTAHRDAALPQGPAQVPVSRVVAGDYVLEVTPSFSVEKDPFALDIDDTSQDSGLNVRLNGQALPLNSKELLRGKPVRITEGLQLSQGSNEFYVKASPPIAESDLDHGIRVRLLNQDLPLADQTIWASQGAVVAGTVSVILAAPEKDHKEDSHDH